jgi:hypothetical protein
LNQKKDGHQVPFIESKERRTSGAVYRIKRKTDIRCRLSNQKKDGHQVPFINAVRKK